MREIFVRPIITLLGIIAFSSVSFAQDGETLSDFPPKKFDARRYEAIWTKNPFVAEVIPQQKQDDEIEDWAKGLILRAVTRIEGKYVVHVEDKALAKETDALKSQGRYQRLIEDADTFSNGGLKIVHVKAHRDPTQVEVTVARANAKEAVVKYDPKALAAKPSTRKTSTARPGAPTTTRRVIPGRPSTPRPPTTTTRRGPGGRGGATTAGGRRGGQGGERGTQTQGRGGRRGSSTPSTGSTTPQRRVVLPPGR